MSSNFLRASILIGFVVALAMVMAPVCVGQDQPQQQSGADNGKATVTGTVTDETGTVVRDAKVVLNSEYGVRLALPVDANGMYSVTGLYPGTYSLTVSASNFADAVFTGFTLTPGKKLKLDATMKPAPAQTAAEAGGAEQGEQSAASVTRKIAGDKSAIRGTVTDQTGAVVVDAKAVLKTATGERLEAPVNARGLYSLTAIAPGMYTLTISGPNFADQVFDNLALTPGLEQTLDASLVPARAKSEEVNVESSGVGQVETENAAVSGTIQQKEVVSLQLNGRNFSQLIALAAGVSNQTGQDEGKVGVVGSVKYSVNGGRVEYNTFEVDGSDVLNTGLNRSASTLVVYPSLDAIQEVKVLTSNYGAQYGRTASGTVQVSTKAGTAKLHGNIYDFIRNEFFNSRNYFDLTPKAPLYRRQDFGGTIGGPLTIPGVFNTAKEKTFFFFSEEVRVEKSPIEYNQAVPGLKERGLIMTSNGIQKYLSPPGLGQNGVGVGQIGQIFDFTDVCPPGVGGFVRNQFPDCPSSPTASTLTSEAALDYLEATPTGFFAPAAVDKNAELILNSNLIPLPNSPIGCNYTLRTGFVLDASDPNRCYDAAVSPSTYWREELFRIDHNLTPKLKASFRYIHDAWNTTVLAPQWSYLSVTNPSAATFPTVQNSFYGPGLNLVASLTHTISATLINNLVVSYTNARITLADKNGTGGAQFQRNPALDLPLVGQAGQCNPVLSADPATGAPECAIGSLFNNGFGGKMPGVAILGTNAAYGGRGFTEDPSYMPWEHTNPTYFVRDDVGKAHGRHTLQFGAQYVDSQRNQDNNVIGAASGEQEGLLAFANQNRTTGNAFADFLLGNIQTFTQDSTQHRYYQRYQLAEPYFQDDWKVSSRFTVNLGLRLSLFGTFHEKYHNAWNWEPSQYTPGVFSVDQNYGELLYNNAPLQSSTLLSNPGIVSAMGFVQCGVGHSPAGCMQGHLFNWAPRIGFAWDPKGDGKTSIRAGYGIFYEHGTGNEANTGSLEASAPVVLSVTQSVPVSYPCIGNVGYGSGFNGTYQPCGVGAPSAGSLYPIDVTSIPTQAIWPYAQQWSLGMQREVSRDFVVNLAYVGSKGTHLTVGTQLNQLPPLPASANPFGPNEPLTIDDCTVPQNPADVGTLFPGANAAPPNALPNWIPFSLQSGTLVHSNSPAYAYLQAACTNFHIPNVNSLVSLVGPSPVPLHPYPGLARVLALQNVANSSYHAVQFTARRTRGALTTGVSYSYSHSIDDSSDRSDPVLVNSYDLAENRASSNFDERHLLTFNYIYQFSLKNLVHNIGDWANAREAGAAADQTAPAPRCCSGLADNFLQGWEFSGITLFHSGTPFSVINTAGNTGISVTDNAGVSSNLGIADSYPDVVRGAPKPGNNSQSFGPLLLNPSQFVAPRGLTFGDAGRNFLNNPSQLNFDMALAKHFKITEASQLEFRAEAFNVFNHTSFRIYDPDNPGSTGNNVISCYAGPAYSAGYKGSGVDCVTGASFLHPVDAHRPRTLQFALKLAF